MSRLINLLAVGLMVCCSQSLIAQDSAVVPVVDSESSIALVSRIAESEEYEAWAALNESNVLLTSSGDVDFGQIMVLLGQHNAGDLSTADLRTEMAKVPNALRWYDTMQKCEKLMVLLQDRYNFASLSEQDLRDLSDRHRQDGIWSVELAENYYASTFDR